MSTPVEHLEHAFEKAIDPLMEDPANAVKAWNKHQYEEGRKAGFIQYRNTSVLKSFGAGLGAIAAILIAFSYVFNYPSPDCPAAIECAPAEEICPMPSHGDWVPRATYGAGHPVDNIVQYTFEDGTRCWKLEGSGSASCLLP